MKVHTFWGGPFSNWHLSDFEDSIYKENDQDVFSCYKFNCVEQYMMICKALLFDDFGIAHEILQTKEPNQQKSLGRQIKNFDETKWHCVSRTVVAAGLQAKFEADENLMNYLLDTAGSVIVEASPHDRIWGVGLKEGDPDLNDMSKWKGLNWLGFLLTDLRVSIIGE